MRKVMYVCLSCVVMLMGCTEETEMLKTAVTPSAVNVSTKSEQDLKTVAADENSNLSEKEGSKEISANPADARKEKYKEAKALITKKKYKEACEILKSLNAYRTEFPKLITLIKKVKILELGRIKKWKDDNGENQITVLGRKVKVKIRYTSKGWKDKEANYTGEISYKQSTAYKIAIVHGDKVDYIRVDDSLYDVFGGCIEYEVYDVQSNDYAVLYSAEGKRQKEKLDKEVKAKNKEEKRQKEKLDKEVEDENKEEIEEQKEVLPAPHIGMTAGEVESSSWGKPEKKNITEYAWGTKEQWVYSGYRYVYLQNGIVISIQRSE